MKTFTDEQAYAAMFYYLKQHWLRTRSNALGDLLSDMQLVADGGPADRAVLKDWEDAVAFALRGGKADSMKLR